MEVPTPFPQQPGMVWSTKAVVVLKQGTWINYQAPNWSLNLVNLHLEQVYNRPVLVWSVCGMVGQFIVL